MEKEKIDVLENMLRRMVEGTLGCSGFDMVETDTLRSAIKELKGVVSLIDNKLSDLKDWMKLDNAIYSQDYEKKKAQIKILNDLRKELISMEVKFNFQMTA